jgi:hypothetical protein
MKDSKEMNKGYEIEEALRSYFLRRGFYVLRGVEFAHKTLLTTDIDLWLYNRPSGLTREQINVDIKSKKNPHTTERIFWTKGVQTVLGFDNCIVATSDKRPLIKEFGDKHNVIILDGHFLNKVKDKKHEERLTEEELIDLIVSNEGLKNIQNWKEHLNTQKSSLLSSLDYSSCIDTLESIKQYFEHSIVLKQKQQAACRLVYLFISYFLIKIDYILKDLAFYDNDERRDRIDKGLKYGNFGESGLLSLIDTAKEITGLSGAKGVDDVIIAEYGKLNTRILGEYFSKYEVGSVSFELAKYFESFAFSRDFIPPNSVRIEAQSLISVLLDYFEIGRMDFFNAFDG